MLLLMTTGYSSKKNPITNYDSEEYLELERLFEERSRAINHEHESILDRYSPTSPSKEDPHDTFEIFGDTESNTSVVASEPQGTVVSDTININKASAVELQKLPGIGPAYANRIIEWREENGPFTSSEQLLEIKGIGEKKLGKILPYIKLKE